jgi:formylglycine-generating enzyme required for sulfatase activity
VGRPRFVPAHANGGIDPSRITGSPYLPLSSVSWDDAVKFCVLLTQSEKKARRLPKGYEYRLPTEAEWEYACRAGSKEQYSVDPDGFWHFNNSPSGPREVGEGKANAWGLYDMHGNVYEWCYDGWQDPPEVPFQRLTDPFTRRGSAKDRLVARGGAWWSQRQSCSNAARRKHGPDIAIHVGFRFVLAPILGR